MPVTTIEGHGASEACILTVREILRLRPGKARAYTLWKQALVGVRGAIEAAVMDLTILEAVGHRGL